MTTQLTIDRTSLSLSPLVLSGDPEGTLIITEEGFGRTDLAWVRNYATARDWDGAVLTDARLDQASLPFTVLVQGSTSVAVEGSVDDLVVALSQFTYDVTVTVDDVETVWTADPADVAFGGYDSGMVAGFLRTVVVTIPVYPLVGGFVTEPAPVVPDTPTGLVSSVVTDTSLTLDWDAVADPDPAYPVLSYYVSDGSTVVDTVDAATLTLDVTGLDPASSHDYRVRATNVNGDSPGSAVETVNTDPAAGSPSRPATCTSASTSTTAADVDWATSTGSPTGYRVFKDGVQVGADLGLVTTKHVTGLSPGSTVVFSVRSFNGSGESIARAATPLDMPGSSGGSGDTLMGVSMSDENHGRSNWDAAHCYSKSDVATSATFNVHAVCFSDKDRFVTGSAANTSAILNDLQRLHTARPNLKIRYSWGNEVDRHVSNYSLFVSNVAAVKAVVDQVDNATMWVSFTGNVFRTPSQINHFTGIASHVFGIAANLYPPGRQHTPPEGTLPYSFFVDPPLEWAHDNGIENFACWETGIPMPTNGSYARPSYMAGLRDYTITRATALGINVTEMCYWDQNIGIDNRLFHDAPATANAWVTF